ncbi:MAG: DUF4367 domain-containing protein [Clostridia bacterium]|nr:DUF4367 domain-containing protein [Clostridia bacterium]
MFKNVQEEVFEGIITSALKEYIAYQDACMPSDEEMEEMYPPSKKMLKKYLRMAKARKYNVSIPILYLRRVAVVFLVLVSITFGVLMIDADVRASVRNAVVKWYDKYAQISFSESADKQETTDINNFVDTTDVPETEQTPETEEIPDMKDLKVGYVPEGFELLSSNETETLREYTYFSQNGDYIMIGVYSSSVAEAAIDIEYSKYEETYINGNEAFILYRESDRVGSLVFGNSKYMVCINSICDRSDLIKVAENIK